MLVPLWLAIAGYALSLILSIIAGVCIGMSTSPGAPRVIDTIGRACIVAAGVSVMLAITWGAQHA